MSGGDLLSGAAWRCAATRPGLITGPAELDRVPLDWMPVSVPGTAAGALRDAGLPTDDRDLDDEDWWFRCRFALPGATADATDAAARPWLLRLGGLATIADVWVNGRPVVHSENMFVAHEVELAGLEPDNELVICCAALSPRLAERRPRPRWKTYLVGHQNLRWLRTMLLGRLPGVAATPVAVGPWRPVRIERAEPLRVVGRRVVAACDGDDGVVEVALRVRPATTSPATTGAASEPASVVVCVGDHRGVLSTRRDGQDLVLEGTLRVPGVERWWPATHGRQPLYPLRVETAAGALDLGRVGFRTVVVRRDGPGFEVEVNGVPVFCRGATWMPVDPTSMAPAPSDERQMVELMVAAHMNMVRLPATGTYQGDAFWDACDELGVLVWQDCPFAFMDYPDDEVFTAAVRHELTQAFAGLGGRPALAVVCGGQEIAEQAAMLALTRSKWTFPLVERVIPEIVEDLLPGVPYVTDNPTGGGVPCQMDAGVSQYFGVGGYLRPLDDARRANVRFASECLAFATPPEGETLDAVFGAGALADPAWRKAVHHDARRSWDLEDVQSHYLGRLFGVDPFATRWRDPERYLDLSRATVASLVADVLSEWRRPGSTCTGALVLALRDLRPGPGWGIVDAQGRPKAPWFALRRVLAPVAVLVTDEGLNGLRLHLVNDGPDPVAGTVVVRLFVQGELCVERGEQPVIVPARSGREIEVADLFDGFRDLTGAFGFGPPAFDVVVVDLLGADGSILGNSAYLPLGGMRPLEPDIGLEATASPGVAGTWILAITTRRFAQWVVVEVPGFRPSESWFHLAPGDTRSVVLESTGADLPRGHVRALNSSATARVLVRTDA